MALIERLAILIDANSQGASREFKKLSNDAASTDRQLTRTQATTQKVGAGFKTLGVLAGAAAAGGLVKFADASLDAASALEEARSKAQVVFGTQFSQIERFATDTADALNLSERAAFQFTAAFGQLFDSVGLTETQTAQYSETLAALAADLASFNDISVDEAFQKIQSGLSGEAEPLRRVGVFLTAAKVEAEAYESGIAEVGSTLTEAQKIQARYNIILRETENAQGDVARTSDSLANQQKNLAASTEDLKASFGESLAPTAAEFTGFLADISNALASYQRATDDWQGDARERLGFDRDTRSLFDVFGEIGRLFSEAEGSSADFNAEVRRVNDSLASIGFESVVPDVERFELATAGTVAELSQMPPALDETENASRGLIDSLGKTRSALDDLPTPTRKYLDEVLVAAPALDDFDAASRGLLDALPPLAGATEEVVAPTDELGGRFAYVADTAGDASDAISILQDAVDRMRSPVLDVRDANREFADAIQEYHDVMESGDSTRRQQEEALDAIADAAFDVLDANAGAGATTAELDKKTESLRGELVKAKSKYDENATAAERYADKVGLIPGDVTTNVRLAGIDSAIAQAQRLQELTTGLSVGQLTSVVRQDRAMENRRRASGGPVGPGTYLVGERGPELLSLSSGTGRVFSNAQTRPMLSSNNSRNLTVNGDVVIQTPDPSRTWDQLNMLAVA